jgi:prepilin-type N-terminal cleavage/methylation domain-containing protein
MLGKMRKRLSCRNNGFTLIEIAIVILIAGLILTALLNSDSLIKQSRVQDSIAIAADLSAASRIFKQRYHYLPGDFLVNTGLSPQIPGLTNACMSGGAGAGNGNGAVELNESPCVPEHLFAAGLIKGGLGPLRSQYGTIQVIANAASQTALGPNPLPANIQNVIEFANLPCDVAREIDRKLDDDNLATGRATASVAACTPKVLNDPVPFFALAL